MDLEKSVALLLLSNGVAIKSKEMIEQDYDTNSFVRTN